MSIFYKVKLVLIFIYLNFSMGLVMADVSEECLEIWNNINFDSKNIAPEQKLNIWKKNKVRCSEEGLYEYGVARFLAQFNRYDEAKVVIKNLLVTKSKFEKEYQLLSADIDFNIAASSENTSQTKWQQVKDNYVNLKSNYPEWYGGYAGLGNLEMGLGNYQQAKDILIKANKLQQSAVAYRALTIIENKNQDYTSAINNADIAYQLDNSLLMDKDFVLAMSNAYMHLGKNKVGLNLLEMLIRKNEKAKNDPEVLSLGKYLYLKVNKK